MTTTRDEDLRSRSCVNPCVVPDEKRDLECFFQVFHLAAEARLGYVKSLCSARDVSFFYDRDEVFEVTEFD